MTVYYPGPYEVELLYTFQSLTHKQRLNCDVTTTPNVGDPLTSVNLKTKAGTPVVASTAIQAWVDLIKPFFGNTTTFTVANLWKYVPNSFEKSFVGTMDLQTVGTSGSSNVLAAQRTVTYRTQIGGKFRITFIEGSNAVALPLPIPTTGTVGALDTFLRGNSNWIIARDGYYPAAGIYLLDGQNEAVFRKRYRPNS